MRTLILAIVALLSLTSCGKEQIISYDQLPSNARTIVERHFDRSLIAYVKKDGAGSFTEYEVKFNNQDEIDFNHKGEVKSVDMKSGAVPSELVPQQIREYVAKNFAGQTIIQYSVERNGYEIELNSGLDIEFDNKFNVRKID